MAVLFLKIKMIGTQLIKKLSIKGKNNYRNVPAGVTYYNNGEVKVIKAGTNRFQPIAWDQEFDNLKILSKEFSTCSRFK